MNNRFVVSFIKFLDDKLYYIAWLMVLLAVFSFASPGFLTALNFKNILLQNTHVMIIAVGLSFIMIAGGIDLSLGYQISLIATVIAACLSGGVGVLPSVFAGFATAVFCGICNGVLATKLHIPPFVVTFTTQMIFRGISFSVHQTGTAVALPEGLRDLARLAPIGVSLEIWLMLICVAVASVIFRNTFFGRQIRAVGEDRTLARKAGINVTKLGFLTYVIASVFYFVATVVLVSKQGVAGATTGPGIELTVIPAVMIGGSDIIGTVMSVAICAILENGLQMIGISRYIQYILVGLIVLGAIAKNRWTDRSGSAISTELF